MTSKNKSWLNPEGKETLTPNDLLEMRKRLVNKFGNKIMGESKPEWTTEEQVASVTYETLTKELYKMAPGVEGPDKIMKLYTENEANNIIELIYKLILKYAIKPFLVVLAVVVLIALLKYIFH